MKLTLVPIAGLVAAVATVNGMRMPAHIDESVLCEGGRCDNTSMKYEVKVASQPGYQWNDAGGYCGSWSIQRASLARGAWISQQQVRDHTSPGGGNGNEILSTNIEEAFHNLKIHAEGFDYKNTPVPQQGEYAKWLKKQLAAGNPVTWMIMWSGQRYPIYDLTPPAGMYGHVEPVIGIQSNHPLSGNHTDTVYDDDVVLHFTDGGINTVQRKLTSLACDWAGVGHEANCRPYSYGIGPYSFGWAIKGFTEPKADVAAEASLAIQPWKQEPDTRSGESAIPLEGTVTAVGLETGTSYDIYRWDSVSDAFTYTDEFKKLSFQAVNATFVYTDDKSFQSSGTTYYRVVPAQ